MLGEMTFGDLPGGLGAGLEGVQAEFLGQIESESFEYQLFVSYTVLMNGLCRDAKVSHAHQLFDRMLGRGLNPHRYSWNVLIHRFYKEGQMRERRSLLQWEIATFFELDCTAPEAWVYCLI